MKLSAWQQWPMSSADSLQPFLLSLREAGIEQPQKELRMLLGHVLQTAPEKLVGLTPCLTPQQFDTIQQLVQRRIAREPMSQILGHQPFWTLDFHVNMHTLTPRADSETLIEAALARIPDSEANLQILDLGTGSGCLLLTLLHEWPNATGIGVDSSDKALAVARENMNRLGLSDRTELRFGHWAKGITETFDVIISNPPYIDDATITELMPEVRDYEPYQALSGGADGLDAYREILANTPARLRKGGFITLELGIGQAADVQHIGEQAGLRHIETRNDLGGIARAITFTH